MSEIEVVKQLFRSCDKDGSGAISASELAKLLNLLGSFTRKEVARMLEVIDVDDDGVVRYDEFINWIFAWRQSPTDLRTSIREGTVCIVKQACTHWAHASGWDRIGQLRAGQQVTASGQPFEMTNHLMVPLTSSSMVEAKFLYIQPDQIDRRNIQPNRGDVPTGSHSDLGFIIPSDALHQHRTNDFIEASADDAAEDGSEVDSFDNPSVILRRGESVRLSVKTSGSSHSVVFHDRWKGSAPPVVCLPAKVRADVKDGLCFTEFVSGGLADLWVGLPPSMPVGEYTVHILQGTDVKDLVVPQATPANRVLILMNPWCGSAEEFVSDEPCRQEYVMLESGLIFTGSVNRKSSIGWEYGQFEPGVLAATRKMLRAIPPEDRVSPISISRAMSAFCNSQDENGVLVGNWSGDYSGGENPTHWKGSVEILSDWHKNREPVKFGQCWVFAGILTSVMRCIGIAARPVTNFVSAHDTHGNRMIDEVYDEDGNKLDETGDSIWNFHVWTEAWMARPDLERTSVATGLGGWQAIDATPQELSGGAYQCGPASLAAIKLGLSTPYDADFVIGEVNADVRRYVRTGGELKLVKTITDHVGRSIMTKALGTWQGQDIVERYKAPEGSALERASLLRSAESTAHLGSLILDLNSGGAIVVGSTATVTLKFVRFEGVNFSAERLTLSLRAFATEYTGRGRTLLASAKAELSITEAEQTGMTLSLDTDGEQFESMLRGSGFPMIIVGIARSSDGEILLVAEEATDLVVAEIELVSVEPKAAPGVKSTVTLRFTNPFKNRPLTSMRMTIKGRRLAVRRRKKLSLPDLGPGETLNFDVDVKPIRRGRDPLLTITLSSSELEGVHGKHIIPLA
mmetsp:Transcript_88501/g.222799  ORF Transcript_88501/g.222799 Transcript_88501/m.222799 type:complete len:855 (-) Transcript_88501:70-2634(-)